jgi:hypothetical protein
LPKLTGFDLLLLVVKGRGWGKGGGRREKKKNEKWRFWRGFWEGHTFDGTVEAVDVTVVASSLVSFVLSHERDELLGGPALGLEIIVVRSRCTCVHLINVSAT